MTALFLSHSSEDVGATCRLRDALVVAGYQALFVDLDDRLGVAGGRKWELELYRQLRRADAVVFLATPASTSSKWCAIEIGLARSLGKDVLPVRVAGCDGYPLLADVQWVDATTDERAGIARLVAGLEAAGHRATDSFTWDPNRPPYPGLVPFQAKDAGVFFGRDAEIRRLVDVLAAAAHTQRARVVTVVGPSGSGKSSLLRAGLLPRLAQQSGRWVVVPPFVPGDRPSAAMARSLSLAFGASGQQHERSAVDRSALERMLRDDPHGLEDLVHDLCAADGGAARVLLVVDQAEELLTRCTGDERRRCLDMLRQALVAGSPLSVIATLRADALGRFLALEGVPELVDEPVVIGAMPRSRLPQVIARPAQRAGLDLEPGLVERIVDDTVGGDALPLMAYALRELVEHAPHGGVIRHEDYEALGGVVGALQRQADAVVDVLASKGLADVVLPTLLRLTTVEPDGEPTRRRLPQTAFRAEQHAVVKAFVEARLLTIDGQAEATAVVEVAHEALLRQWRPLREAIDDARRDLETVSELERLAHEWQLVEGDESYLLRGARLARAEGLGADRLLELGSPVRELVAESRARSAVDAERARRVNRRLRGLVAGLAVLLVTSVTALGFGLRSAADARDEATLSRSRELAATAQQLLPERPHLGMLVGLESARTAPTAQALTALSLPLQDRRHPVRSFSDHGRHVFALAQSASGDLTASAGSAGSIRVWDTESGQAQAAMRAGDRPVYSLSFSPDDRLLASAGGDGLVRLWDAQTGVPAASPFRAGGGAVRAVAFSPDGQVLASAAGKVQLLDPATGLPLGAPLSSMNGWAMAFSPRGDRLVVTGTDGRFQLWDWRTRRPLTGILRAHDGVVTEVAFTADGRLLASVGHDGLVKVWDGETLRPRAKPLGGQGSAFYAVAWSPAGDIVASAGLDGDVQLWDWRAGRSRGVLTGQDGETNAVAFTPGGRSVMSAGEDGVVRFWDPQATRALGDEVIPAGELADVALSADGEVLASIGADGAVRTWNARDGRLLNDFRVPEDFTPYGIDISSDGSLVAAASGGRVVVWDTGTGSAPGPPLAGQSLAGPGFGDDVLFSPDGNLLATFDGEDGGVHLWNVRGRRALGHLEVPDGRLLSQIAFSPDSRVIVTAESWEDTIQFWDVSSRLPTSEPLALPEDVDGALDGQVPGVTFTPDGDLVAAVSTTGRVHLWDASTHERADEPLPSQEGLVYDVVFSADGNTLATGGGDGLLRLWDVPTRRMLTAPLPGSGGAMFELVFDPMRQGFLTLAEDGALRSWPRPSQWVAATCALVGRNLDLSEWDRWVGSEQEYVRTCPSLPSGREAPAGAAGGRYAGPLNTTAAEGTHR